MTQAVVSRLMKFYFLNFCVLHELARQVPGKASNHIVMLNSFLHTLNKMMIIRNSVLLNLCGSQ